jgi:adenylate cyclase
VRRARASAPAGAGEQLLARQVSAHGPNSPVVLVALVLALLLPLLGLVLLLGGDHADRRWDHAATHFVLFLCVGALATSLALIAADAARERGDARVLLLALGFFTTGSFMALHAVGTRDVLVDRTRPGLDAAISVGLALASLFAVAAASVDLRPALAPWVVRHQQQLRAAVLAAIGLWTAWSLAEWPPLQRPFGEGGAGSVLPPLAAAGALLYLASAVRFWWVHRGRSGLQVVSVVACFALLGEAMIGVALTGERKWHVAWWEWHALVVVAYALVFVATRREWRDERFRRLYLPGTRECHQVVTVLVSDLAGFTPFVESRAPTEVTAMLRTYYEMAAPVISRRHGGEIEKFVGDGVFATFNRRGDQPDHAVRACRAALDLQAEVTQLRQQHPDWPGVRVGVNSGDVVVCEVGGSGYVAYPAVGDPVNVAARLQACAPVGGVLIGHETYVRLPDGTDVAGMPGLRLKGKDAAVNAYLLRALPGSVPRSGAARVRAGRKP